MGRSTRARKYQENRSAKPSTPQRTSPRSKTNRNGKSSSTAPALAAQLVTPSSPSSSESHTEVAQEIVVWTEGMTISSASHDEEPNESPLSKADLDLREAPDPTVQSEVVSETIESSLSVFTDASELSSLLSTISSGVTTPIEVDAPTHVLLGAPTARRARKSPSISTFSSLTSIADGNDSAIGSPTVISAQTLPSLVASTTVDVDSLSPPLNPPSAESHKSPDASPPPPETPALCDNVAKLAPPASDTTRRPFYASPNISDVQGPERIVFNVRPKSSIPSDLSPAEYASQCIEGAENSRLNPFILHAGEYEILRNHLSYVQVTTYLNIRNGILRLWIRNPRVAVTREEAVGCAGSRWANAASFCYDWLARNGYINYGCLQFPAQSIPIRPEKEMNKRKTIVVIGAGLAGLGCARQLEGLFRQYSLQLDKVNELPPRVILLEGRSRVGGRVYSRPFVTKPSGASPRLERCTAEMGGMIITGFIGNPLNILVRAQLGLPYHVLNSRTTIFDYDGKAVKEDRDLHVERLYNDCLDRAVEYKYKIKPPKLVKGNRELIMEARDACSDGQKTIAQKEEEEHSVLTPQAMCRITGPPKSRPTAAEAARSIGWTLRHGVSETCSLDTATPASAPGATLGSVVDSCFTQYSDIVDLTDQDFRLFNWHVANLEYSNATNIHNLSLGGWDIDAGNEWVGKHTMIVGGYQRVARGLLHCPSPLDARMKTPIRKINYNAAESSGPATIECEDGTVIEADRIVSTIPLGVLKHGDVEFNPPLPSWKVGPIQRLGYGVLNKVILVYKKPFWDQTRHIFGALRRPENVDSLDQVDYRSQRGRFFQFLDVTATTGLPCLVALMAGDAAVDTETALDDDLVREATEVLRTIFGQSVPPPLEVTVARWAKDRFSRGSYSSSGPSMLPTDYDTMAKPVGNLYFAGEHTIGTHPATVHGAYLSGLRAAGEVLSSLIGDIDIPTPLLVPTESQALKRKLLEEPKDPLGIYEEQVYYHTISQIGERPMPPEKLNVSAYRLYCATNQDAARERCQAGIRPGKRKGKAGPNEVRHMLSKMWKQTSPEEKKPFEDMVAERKAAFVVKLAEYERLAPQWDEQAVSVRAAYISEHPFVQPGMGEDGVAADGNEGRAIKQRRRKHVSYTENRMGVTRA